jgi:ABC-type dipeptide/oligopeptide/nickel transport system ATPase component
MASALPSRFKIALAGPSGSGKTTTAWFIQRLVPGTVILSVAAPLREIEEFMYRRMGSPPPSATGAQDGQLLQAVRGLLLERDPNFLERTFSSSVATCRDDASIVNDDCRVALYPTLRSMGFTFVWVAGNHLGKRADSTKAKTSTGDSHDKIVPKDECDYIFDNTHTFEELPTRVFTFLRAMGLSL